MIRKRRYNLNFLITKKDFLLTIFLDTNVMLTLNIIIYEYSSYHHLWKV